MPERRGAQAVSVEIGITSQALSQWTRVPAEHAPTVARLAGLTPHDVCPDVYGPADIGPAVEECAA